MIAVFPPGAGGVFVLAFGLVLWLFVEFVVRKRRSLRTWIVDGILATLVVVGTALLPLRAHARIASLGLGFIVFVPLIFVGVFICSWLVIRRFRRGLVRGDDPLEDEPIPIPPDLEPARDAFVELGFENVSARRLASGSTIVHLILAEEGIVAEIVSHPPPHDPTPILEINSILAGRVGVLATSTYGLGARLWPGELRQVFPGATAGHLLESHLDGLAFLRNLGIDADPIRGDEILEVREEMLARSKAAAARATSKQLKSELIRAAHGRHAAVGTLASQGDIDARIDAFYGLRARFAPRDDLPPPPAGSRQA